MSYEPYEAPILCVPSSSAGLRLGIYINGLDGAKASATYPEVVFQMLLYLSLVSCDIGNVPLDLTS